MTGASLEMMLRRHAADETAVLRLGTDTGELVITDPVNGQFTLRITQDVLGAPRARAIRPIQHHEPRRRLQVSGLDRNADQ